MGQDEANLMEGIKILSGESILLGLISHDSLRLLDLFELIRSIKNPSDTTEPHKEYFGRDLVIM